MIKKCFYLIMIITIAILSQGNNYAWWSLTKTPGSTTHYKLTDKSLQEIEKVQTYYPDIYRFRNQIRDWTTGPGDDANAHGKKYEDEYGVKAGDFNGGPYSWWWERKVSNDGVLVKYKQRNFVNGDYSAYYYLAMMCHLIADEAVPAHAANILHASFFSNSAPVGDNFENYADNKSPEGAGTIVLPDIFHYYYYQDLESQEIYGLIQTTQNKLTGWKHPDSNLQYWKENPTYKNIGEMFYNKWGNYGGTDNLDIYDNDVADPSGTIIKSQFLDAVDYMVGFLEKASKKLPPIVSNISLSNTITRNNGALINFTVDENRKPNIRIKITVDNIPIKGTIDWDGGALTELILSWSNDNTQLPYKDNLQITWTGVLSDGNYPSDGTHFLKVEVEDADNNWSDALAIPFTFDQYPPTIENKLPPNGEKFNVSNINLSATIIETGSGINVNKLKILINESPYYNYNYNPLTGEIDYTINLTDGNYTWRIDGEDNAGNKIVDTNYTFVVDIVPPSLVILSPQ